MAHQPDGLISFDMDTSLLHAMRVTITYDITPHTLHTERTGYVRPMGARASVVERGGGEAGMRENVCTTTSNCKLSTQVDARRRDVTTRLIIIIILIISTITRNIASVHFGFYFAEHESLLSVRGYMRSITKKLLLVR